MQHPAVAGKLERFKVPAKSIVLLGVILAPGVVVAANLFCLAN